MKDKFKEGEKQGKDKIKQVLRIYKKNTEAQEAIKITSNILKSVNFLEFINSNNYEEALNIWNESTYNEKIDMLTSSQQTIGIRSEKFDLISSRYYNSNIIEYAPFVILSYPYYQNPFNSLSNFYANTYSMTETQSLLLDDMRKIAKEENFYDKIKDSEEAFIKGNETKYIKYNFDKYIMRKIRDYDGINKEIIEKDIENSNRSDLEKEEFKKLLHKVEEIKYSNSEADNELVLLLDDVELGGNDDS